MFLFYAHILIIYFFSLRFVLLLTMPRLLLETKLMIVSLEDDSFAKLFNLG